MTENTFFLSIIIPVFNEEKNILPLLKRLLPVIKKYNHEIVFVDDGSTDKTVEIIKSEAKKNRRIKLVSLLRNFGHQMALFAGYHHVRGDVIISLDADLQDPPELIPKMIDEWQKGAKVVYAKREKREVDSFFKKITAKIFYRLINFISDVPIPQNVGDFRLLDKEVVNFLKNLSEKPTFLRGLVAWPQFPSSFVYFNREKRFSGKTHYPLSKMINFALEGITAFSIKPLRLATYLGFLTSFLAIFIIIFKSFQHFILKQGDWLPGWASLFFAIVFLGGVQLITIGIIGEYVGKIYQEIQKRPNYLVKEKINFHTSEVK